MGVFVKTRRWIRRIALTLITSVAVATVVGLILNCVERKRNEEEEYAVYSAYLSEGLLNDAHDWSVGGRVQVVIEDITKVDGNLRWRGLYVVDRRVRFNHLLASTYFSFLVRNLVRTRMQSKFSLPRRATVALASRSDIQPELQGSPEFQKRFPHNMEFITLSGVGSTPLAPKPCSTSTISAGCAAAGDMADGKGQRFVAGSGRATG